MSSSVRSRICPPATSTEEQIDDVVAEEEQRRGAGDEGEPDDRDRGARQHLGDLTPARPADEDHAEHREQDGRDVTGEEGYDPLGVDALRLGGGERTLLER